ncbi:hypothetical protein C1645_839537 [Glomus cerebriforme]|uniref:Uncharacterized protein n=1 Tax=Glomus cerebriforme TaxID=658196 RepID=A0A397S7I6_9GLOM|nr:hypothetical protein C1645_839537 [Glomus cerebriforme]
MDSTEDQYHMNSASQTPPVIPLSTNSQNQNPPTVFYYQPPNDYYHYHINCKKISCNDVISLLDNKEFNIQLNEHNFYLLQRYDNQIYQISCEVVSPYSITYYLNKNIYSNEIVQNSIVQEKLEFSFKWKENIEFHLTQYLSQFDLLLN